MKWIYLQFSLTCLFNDFANNYASSEFCNSVHLRTCGPFKILLWNSKHSGPFFHSLWNSKHSGPFKLLLCNSKHIMRGQWWYIRLNPSLIISRICFRYPNHGPFGLVLTSYLHKNCCHLLYVTIHIWISNRLLATNGLMKRRRFDYYNTVNHVPLSN